MNMKKLISLLLAVLMLTSALTIITSAAGTGSDEPKYSTKTDGVPQMDYKSGLDFDKNPVITPEQKLALMDYRYGDDKYELYVDGYSGEVAIRSKATGDTLFTNPYNISQDKYASTTTTQKMSEELLSQLKVYYTDIKTNITGNLNSFSMAAMRNQIVVKNIKGGIRVEYSIGREESQSLLPHMIEGKTMEAIYDTIEQNMEAAIAAGTVAQDDAGNERLKLTKFKSFYVRYCLDEAINEETRTHWKEQYKILEKFEELAKTDESYKGIAIYVLDKENIGEQQMKTLETLIKTYHKEFTFQDLQEAHAFVEYEMETENYPHFKMALEYSLDEDGLVVRLPANGIRFDESLFRLDYIEVLPYMGAGKSPNEGYTFFPDGSGTLFDFQEMAGINKEYKGKIYGQDFAYHQPSGMYEEIIRYPVFGLYEKAPVAFDENGNATEYRDRGFVAIIEEGDSLMELASVHGGRTNEYNTIKMRVYPRPTDSYSLADSISVGSNDEWTVVSARKYTGSYKIKYVMLTDDKVAENVNTKCYTPSYVGMANVYRDYLVKNGILNKLTAEQINKDAIPLYIETFGALQTTEKFLSIPVNVMTPLTTFEDITKMYSDLKGKGITNVNFIMKGFTKGGMTAPSVPYNLRWERAVSKEMDFDELLENARTEGYTLFPDFDFVFSSSDTLFDGLNLNKHAAKTIDDRYTSKREYSATKHTYVSFFELVISPAYFDRFYEKFIPKFAETNPMGISVSTLGAYLNSDFDEDEPYNRADGQKFTVEAFEYISNPENYGEANVQIMTSGGNAYSWKFVDHITDISLDSSRYAKSSAAVPFLGIVLHGYVQTAGTPINMEGNLDYALLKAIENGAGLKFILSYRNTEKLKEYENLSKYYSVNYDIWYSKGQGDLVTMYTELNELLKDVQLSEIVGHEFVTGMRVPDNDELALDAAQIIKDTIAYEEALTNANSEDERLAIFNARQLIVMGDKLLKNSVDGDIKDSLMAKINRLKELYDGGVDEQGNPISLTAAIADAEKALEEFRAVQQFHAIYSDSLKNSFGDAYNRGSKDYAGIGYTIEAAIEAYRAYETELAKKPEERSEDWTKIQAEWDRWQKILGVGYTSRMLAMFNAEKALKDGETALEDAKKTLKDAELLGDTDKVNEAKENVLLAENKIIELQDAYDKAVEAYESPDNIAGSAADVVDKMVAAMKNPELNALKDAYIAAAAGTDAVALNAAKEAFEAKIKEVYGDLDTTDTVDDDGILLYNVYSITIASEEGKPIGGSQYLRDYYKNTVYKNAAKAVDDKLNELYALAEEIQDTQELYNKVYSAEKLQEAIKYIEAKNAYTPEEREKLKIMSAELDEFVKNNVDYKAVVSYEPVDVFKLAIASYKELYDATDASGVEVNVGDIRDFEISGAKATTYFTSPEYKRVDKNPTGRVDVTIKPVEPVRNDQKYVSDDNMIVHETFANGKEFLLNFNDFRVVVELNGETYTVDAYGYLIIKSANNA